MHTYVHVHVYIHVYIHVQIYTSASFINTIMKGYWDFMYNTMLGEGECSMTNFGSVEREGEFYNHDVMYVARTLVLFKQGHSYRHSCEHSWLKFDVSACTDKTLTRLYTAQA